MIIYIFRFYYHHDLMISPRLPLGTPAPKAAVPSTIKDLCPAAWSQQGRAEWLQGRGHGGGCPSWALLGAPPEWQADQGGNPDQLLWFFRGSGKGIWNKKMGHDLAKSWIRDMG